MQQQIGKFLDEHKEKSPIFLINFPLQAENTEQGIQITERMLPANHKMLDIISSFGKEINSSLLLLADDKSAAIRLNTPKNIIYHDTQLNNARRHYFHSNKIPELVTGKGLSDNIIMTPSGRPIFSELKLGGQSEKIFSNSCAQTYHTLLADNIDWRTHILISLIPRSCYANLSHYLSSEVLDDLHASSNLAVQNIFMDENDSSPNAEYKIIEI